MAFPSTPILDSFNRADENPLSGGGNWTAPIYSGEGPLKLASNTVTSSLVAPAPCGDYWSTTKYGPNCEVYATLAGGAPNTFSLWARINNPNTGSEQGYLLDVNATNGQVRVRYTVGSNRTNIVAISLTPGNGDKLGMRLVNNAIQAWWQPSGGVWVLLFTCADEHYRAAGFIGLRSESDTCLLDDFGGGTIPTQSLAFRGTRPRPFAPGTAR